MIECKRLRPLLQYVVINYAIAVKPAELDGLSSIVIYLTAKSKYRVELDLKNHTIDQSIKVDWSVAYIYFLYRISKSHSTVRVTGMIHHLSLLIEADPFINSNLARMNTIFTILNLNDTRKDNFILGKIPSSEEPLSLFWCSPNFNLTIALH